MQRGLSNVVVKRGEGVAFYSHIISSQSFSELILLNGEFHQCFQFYFFCPYFPQQLDWTGVGHFPFSAQVASDHSPVGQAMVNQFPLQSGLNSQEELSALVYEYFKHVSLFHFMLEAPGNFFLPIFTVETQFSSWGCISQFYGDIPMTGSLEVFNSHTYPLEPLAIYNYSSYFFYSTSGFCDNFCLQVNTALRWTPCMCLSLQSGKQWFSMYLPSLKHPRQLLIFQSVHFLLVIFEW